MSRILFDIGASFLRVAELTADGIGSVSHIATPADPHEAVRHFADLVSPVSIEAAFGGIPAIVSSDGSVTDATNLPAWRGFAFKEELEYALGAPVQVRNDAELAGLGEAVYGAGKGARIVAYLGLGTGVGTARIIEGVIEPHSSDGTARESIMALSEGGTLEERVGGRSLTNRYGMAPQDLSRDIWNELTPFLAESIEHTITLWSPDVVVLGGSLMNEENGFRIADIQAALDTSIPVRVALCKDQAGLYGARAWAEEFEKP